MPETIPVSYLDPTPGCRKVLDEHYPTMGWPFQGGGGYEQLGAVILDAKDPGGVPGLPFDGIGWENAFVEKRIDEERIISGVMRKKNSGAEWERTRQALIEAEDGRSWDRLEVRGSAARQGDWIGLKEWRGRMWRDGEPTADRVAVHSKKRDVLQVVYTKDYWFVITMFFGNRGVR